MVSIIIVGRVADVGVGSVGRSSGWGRCGVCW